MRIKNVTSVFLISTLLIGCSAQRTKPKEVISYKKFSAPLNTDLSVQTGDPLFLEGKYVEGEEIIITEPLDLMIPGSMFIPFPVFIDQGNLELTSISSKWKYYCGAEDKVAASFPGLGSVIRSGDCVGIRISKNNPEKAEWVVDNSNYNRMTTIYTSSLSKNEKEIFKPLNSKSPFKVYEVRKIVFDGFYGGQIHFTWTEIIGNNKSEKEFTFDFNGAPTQVGIKGNIFTINSADNIYLNYKWNKISN